MSKYSLVIQSKGRGSLASEDEREGWLNSTYDNFKLHCEISKNIVTQMNNSQANPEMYEVDTLFESLQMGKVVYFPMIKFRAVVGDEVCLLCGATFEEGMGSLSRRDNETVICSDCGTAEAMEDFVQVKK